MVNDTEFVRAAYIWYGCTQRISSGDYVSDIDAYPELLDVVVDAFATIDAYQGDKYDTRKQLIMSTLPKFEQVHPGLSEAITGD